jgi:hypothetical protein
MRLNRVKSCPMRTSRGRANRLLLIAVVPFLGILVACTSGIPGPADSSAGAGSTGSGATSGNVPGEPVDCLPAGLGGTYDNWAFDAVTSQSQGLVLNNLRFGPRRLADQISVAYVRITNVTSGKTYVGYLTPSPDSPSSDVTSRLAVPAHCATDGGEPLVEATYAVTVASEHVTFLVHQEYRFDTSLDSHCEATETAQCRRFWPTVSWALDNGGQANATYRFGVVQHFSLDPDRVAGDGLSGAADLVEDVPHLGNVGVNDLAGNGALKKAGAAEVLKNGQVVVWENWHQTGRARVGLPSIKPGVVPPEYDGGTAGCTECVHIHWSWFGHLSKTQLYAMNLLSCGSLRCWSDGKPEIADGSKQTACIGWTTSPVTQPVDWCDTRHVSTAPLAADRPVQMYWDVSSSTADLLTQGVSFDGQHYTRGDSYWPRLYNRKHGGNGSIFFTPARAFTTVQNLPAGQQSSIARIQPQWPATHIDTPGDGLPAGWVLPVRITPGASEQGPFYLRVSSPGLQLLNADPDYSARFGGTPWVRIYDDHLGSGGQWVSRLGPPHTIQAYKPGSGPMTAVLVFSQQPSPKQVSLRLDAAPSGVGSYTPSNGTWPQATSIRYQYATISLPGYADTLLQGINNSGTYAGTAYNAGFANETMFVRQNGKTAFFGIPFGDFDPASDAGKLGFIVSGIDGSGEVIGIYDSSGGRHSFIRSPDGTMTELNVPGAVGTSARSISTDGIIVGEYSSQDGKLHGFIDRQGDFTTYDEPNAVTGVTSLSFYRDSDGMFGGRYATSTGALQAFYVLGGQAHDIDSPGSSARPDGYGFNVGDVEDNGTIYASLYLPGKTPESLVDSNGVITDIQFPGTKQGEATFATDANQAGVVVGSYQYDAAGDSYGFIARPSA